MTTKECHSDPKIDWRYERDRVDLVAVATDLLGSDFRRSGRKYLHRCPWHDDHSPSLVVDPDKKRWKCWPCGIGGDAVDLVMRHQQMTFPEAIAYLTGAPAPSGTTRHRPTPSARVGPKPPPVPSGMPPEAALALVVEAEARLWSPEGAEGLAYLAGDRCLTLETIKLARLGWTPPVDRVAWKPPGITIPWLDGDRLTTVKIRPPDAWRESFPKDKRPPKYIEAFRDRPTLYPSPGAIRAGRPLVIAEGELDALLLGQELGRMVGVVTCGGTGSTKPEPGILGCLLAAYPWFVGTDSDEAGDKAAARWEGTRAIRVRPPIRPPHGKDWTDCALAGINLRRWWTDRLGDHEAPPLFTWDELIRWPGLDPGPGIVVDRPDPERRRLALEALGTGPGDAFEGDLP